MSPRLQKNPRQNLARVKMFTQQIYSANEKSEDSPPQISPTILGLSIAFGFRSSGDEFHMIQQGCHKGKEQEGQGQH